MGLAKYRGDSSNMQESHAARFCRSHFIQTYKHQSIVTIGTGALGRSFWTSFLPKLLRTITFTGEAATYCELHGSLVLFHWWVHNDYFTNALGESWQLFRVFSALQHRRRKENDKPSMPETRDSPCCRPTESWAVNIGPYYTVLGQAIGRSLTDIREIEYIGSGTLDKRWCPVL